MKASDNLSGKYFSVSNKMIIVTHIESLEA